VFDVAIFCTAIVIEGRVSLWPMAKRGSSTEAEAADPLVKNARRVNCDMKSLLWNPSFC
jgi:hypothetical protein